MIKTREVKNVFCSHPWKRIKIDSEGHATMCCFHQRKCLGNILEKGFDSIWNGDIANDIRCVTSSKKMHTTCSGDTCPFIHVQNNLQKIFEIKISDNRKVPPPKELEIDLPTQWCNIGGLNPNEKNPACIMCERHTKFAPQEDRLKDVCKILRKFIFEWVHIQGVAEPFWKDRIFEIMDDLNLWGSPETLISTTTNGTILSESRIRKFLQMPKTTITFSIDAATPETYKKIRRIDAYDKLIESLMLYDSLRGPQQRLQIHNSINTMNVMEVVGMVEIAAKANVDQIEFNPTYDTPDICVSLKNVESFRQAETEIINVSKSLGVNVVFMRNLTLDFFPKLVELSI